MAPEMLLKKGHNLAVDHYCLGALLYELITGLPPYYSHNTDEIYEAILFEELTFPDNLHISPEL
jgi:serine/threonine protein kinase